MTSAPQRIAALSPEKRELLLRRWKAREQQDVLPQGRGQEGGQVPNRGQLYPPLRAYDRSEEDHNVTPAFPLSFAQQRLWFLHQLEPGSPVYNISTFLHAVGPFSLQTFLHGLAMLIQRHETLRTTFSVLYDQSVQVIAPWSAPKMIISPWGPAMRAIASLTSLQDARRSTRPLTTCGSRRPSSDSKALTS